MKLNKSFLISKGNLPWASQIRNAGEKPRVEIGRLHAYGAIDLKDCVVIKKGNGLCKGWEGLARVCHQSLVLVLFSV